MAAPASPRLPALPYTRRLTCEQLIYTWAEQTLSTSHAGLGVVGRSAGWPEALHQGFCDYVPSSKLYLVESGQVAAPVGLARYGTEHGALVVSRRANPAGHGRPGNYIVHALLDPTGRLGAREALALYLSPRLATTWAGGPPKVLPQLVLARPEQSLEEWADDESRLLLPVLLQAALQHHRTGRQVALLADSEAEGVTWLRHVAAALPTRLAAQLTFSTYEPSPVVSTAALVLHRPDLQEEQLPSAVPIVTRASTELPHGDDGEAALAAELAESYLGGRLLPPRVDGAADPHQLRAALNRERLALVPFADLTVADLDALGTTDARWLATHLDDVLARLHVQELTPPLLDALAITVATLPDEERRATQAELLGDEAAALLRGQDGFIWPLLERLGVQPARLPEEALRVATARLRNGALPDDELELATELLLQRPDLLSREEHLPWLTLTTVPARIVRELRWGRLHDSILRQYVGLPAPASPLCDAVALMPAHHPDELLAEVNRLLRDAGVSPVDLARRLMTAAPDDAPPLLLRSGLPARVLRGEILRRVQDPDRRLQLAQQSWPAFAADWPREVIDLLEPVRRLEQVDEPEPEQPRRRLGILPRRRR